MNKLKVSLYSIALLGIGYGTYSMYHYFFDDMPPEVVLRGIEDCGSYTNDVSCILEGSDGYKVSKFSIFLDNKFFIKNNPVHSRSFEYPFTLAMNSLTPGKHVLRIEVMNRLYRAKKTILERSFFVDNEPLKAAFMSQDCDLKVLQGRTLHVKIHANKKIKEANVMVRDLVYRCLPESELSMVYECFIPIACEQEAHRYPLAAKVVDPVGNAIMLETSFEVIPGQFKRQQLNVLAEKVKQEKEVGLDNQVLEDQLVALSKNSVPEKRWSGRFYAPTDIKKISTEFGSIRATKEKGLYHHEAVDILNLPKSVVWAPHDGVVVIKDRFALSGNTVGIDHGRGIISLLFHLDSFADGLEIGTQIKRGNPLGLLGMTGYATGYHLHWEMRVANIKVDPMQWISETF